MRTQRWSREVLEPHARVAHVRDADKTCDGTLREKNHVCGNLTLRAGLVSCVHLGERSSVGGEPLADEVPIKRRKRFTRRKVTA